jgi:xylulokinase
MHSPSSPVGGSALAVGLDLGTSGMKAVALDESGHVVARAQAGYPTARPEAGASEQDPAAWIAAVVAIAEQVRAATDNARWAVIGLSGMIPTAVIVDAEGQHLGPAITWEDARAEPDGDALRDAVGSTAMYLRTGQWVDGRYLLPMFARLARVESDRVAASRRLLGAKDYLFAWLTGEYVTDPSTATGFGCYDLSTGTWNAEIVTVARSLAGASLDLPDVRPSISTTPLVPVAAAALGLQPGIPVCLGAADSVLGAFGLGVREPGDVAYVGGTSTIVLGVADHVILDDAHRFLVTPLVHPDRWGLEMDLLATGSAFRWLAGLLRQPDESALLALAAASSAIEPPVFLPFVAPGEQGALWDPNLTGVLQGLNLASSAADIARALVNGVILESRRCLMVLEDNGFERGPLRVSGGSASDPWFRQQLADASGRRVVAGGGSDTDRSAAGAASIAAEAIGWAPAVLDPARDSSDADPGRAADWASSAARHEAALVAVRRSKDA